MPGGRNVFSLKSFERFLQYPSYEGLQETEKWLSSIGWMTDSSIGYIPPDGGMGFGNLAEVYEHLKILGQYDSSEEEEENLEEQEEEENVNLQEDLEAEENLLIAPEQEGILVPHQAAGDLEEEENLLLAHEQEGIPVPHQADLTILPPQEEEEEEVDIQPVYNPKALKDWVDRVSKPKEDLGIEEASRTLSSKAKQHLKAIGWGFKKIVKKNRGTPKGKKELSYTSPLNRRKFASLVTACRDAMKHTAPEQPRLLSQTGVPSSVLPQSSSPIYDEGDWQDQIYQMVQDLNEVYFAHMDFINKIVKTDKPVSAPLIEICFKNINDIGNEVSKKLKQLQEQEQEQAQQQQQQAQEQAAQEQAQQQAQEQQQGKRPKKQARKSVKPPDE